MNPGVSNARWQFKLRPLVNAGGVVLAFIVGAVLFEAMGIWFIGELLLIAVLFYLYFFILDKRAIRFDCPHCRKKIASNTPWVCGFCNQTNRQVDDYPFVHRCGHCGAEPKAYLCHHCGTLIFLSDDEFKESYARSVGAPVVDTSEIEEKAEARLERNLQHQLRVARMNAQLKAILEQCNPPPKLGPREALQEHFSKEKAYTMGAHEIADQELAQAEIDYQDNPNMLERERLFIKSWLENRLIDGPSH